MRASGALSLLAALQLARAHVPLYAGKRGCVQPRHKHTTSQAVYVRGSGGLEIPILDDSDPFDVAAGEEIDIDVVFRDDVDLNSFDLHIGCGGCDDGDPLPPQVTIASLGGGKVEPFSQTYYREALTRVQKKFNVTSLGLADCPDKRFAIRLVEAGGTANIRWAAVVGLDESFTNEEWRSLGVYALMNHGVAWNDVFWTFYLILGLVIVGRWFYPVWRLVAFGDARYCLCTPCVNPAAWWQAVFFEISFIGFATSLLEFFVHLCIAQARVPAGGEFWISLFFVILIPHGLAFWLLYTAYSDAINLNKDYNRLLQLVFFVLALLFFYALGAGLFLGPAGLAIGCLLWIARSEQDDRCCKSNALPTYGFRLATAAE